MAQQFRRKPVGGSPIYEPLPVKPAISSHISEVSEPSYTSSFLHAPGSHDEVPESRVVSGYHSNGEKASIPRQKPTKWGIHWRKPTFIVSMLLLGLGLSLGHHFYYSWMNNQVTGDASRQAWPTRIGTGLAFLVTSFLKAATMTSLGQYIWTVVKRQPLTMSSLDRLFSLSTDPLGLFYWELMKSAKIALFLGLIVWLLGLASVAPSATLTVVAQNITGTASVATLDWSLAIWSGETTRWIETLAPNTVAVRAANDINVVPLPAPVNATEWSYDLQFFGPSLQCAVANSTEQVVFDNVTGTMAQQDNLFTYTKITNKDYSANTANRLLWSVWSTWFGIGAPNSDWIPRILEYGVYDAYIMPQIWVQTSTQGIVCNAVNSSFDVTISFKDGMQQIIQNNIQILGNYSTPYVTITDLEPGGENSDEGGTQEVQYSPYLPHLYAIGTILAGNVSLDNVVDSDQYGNQEYAATIDSNMMTTGLTACDDIVNSPFKSLAESNASPNSTVVFMNTFPSTPWMCRNKTLIAAIQDLANNITISYLSSPQMTGNKTVLKTIQTSNTVNKYQYHPFYLFVSYGLALLFSFIAALVGFYSIFLNGVSHSMSFSAIVAATRNSELDALTGRSSLGADPMQPENESLRLKLGPLLDVDELKYTGVDPNLGERGPHVAFGLENNVGRLRKGEIYS
ncbi:uncharacterized protein LY89DRAFT_742794 [Mollisia scopiformis]|uniref:Uncharacterized protein n=1 Tax=Mollisia scopiformis TaxID=149040 RepID=A0A132B578_MOLSC|nr:uncharacterized protein LY89DRAFT_742794 [Mollisia scopiformis]KUJ07565.1 hypothetical protein LY89DRAFT_742794 [Mollisia scopiformis]